MHIHFFAAARAAAGTAETTCNPAELPQPTVGALTDYLAARFTGTTPSGQTLAEILPRCSFLLDGRASEPTDSINDAHRLDVLPPFAGG